MVQAHTKGGRTVTLKINASLCGLTEQLIKRYQMWHDYRNFYKPSTSNSKPLLENSESGIPCYPYTSINEINQNENSLIAIDCLTEGIHSMYFFKKYNKSNQYLIFSNGTWDISYYDLKINYRIMYHKFFLFEMADTYNTPNKFCYYLDKKYNFLNSKSYIFVSTIGNIRPERTYLVKQLMSKLKYKNFLLRYSGEDINGIGNSDIIKIEPGNFDPYTHILKKYYHSISQTLPIELFNQGHVNLIVETDINWANEFFLTEKTIKNLIIGMPFIIVGTPHFLKNLKALGFETYSSLWDEGYDDIEDYCQRIDKIVELCNNLLNFDWESNQTELIRIGQQNQLNFLNLNKVIDQEFLEIEKTIRDLQLT